MSRIGKLPIILPQSVTIALSDSNILVKGKLGALSMDILSGISVTEEEGSIQVSRKLDNREIRAQHGLTRALIQNLVTGVSEGFKKKLIIEGIGYQAIIKGKMLLLHLGYTHPILLAPPKGITFEVPEAGRIVISGIDKQLVGNITAKIRSFRKPEPYKGKGIRYIDEIIKRKAGKAAVGTES